MPQPFELLTTTGSNSVVGATLAAVNGAPTYTTGGNMTPNGSLSGNTSVVTGTNTAAPSTTSNPTTTQNNTTNTGAAKTEPDKAASNNAADTEPLYKKWWLWVIVGGVLIGGYFLYKKLAK